MTTEEAFTKALELPEGEREAFLCEIGGRDVALRRKVERLLRHHHLHSTLIDEQSPDFAGMLVASAGSSPGGHSQAADAPLPDPDSTGPVSFGDYLLEEKIGRGSMGVVYRARQRSLNRTVAIKIIRFPAEADEEDIAWFRSEAELAASVDHPNIIPIHEVGEHDGQHYFSMKFIEGDSMKDRIGALRNTPRQAVELMISLARAVHAAHSSGLIHRDIKPGNVMIDEEGRPHIGDFGLAERREGPNPRTLDGKMAGTPYYMAPEQATGDGRQVTTAADIYSLGVILYEVLTGSRPHEAETVADVLCKVIEEEPRPARELSPGLDRDMEAISLRCLNKRPEDRYGSADALANDLERWLQGQPVIARPVRTPVKVLKWMRRRPVYAMLWGGLLLLLLVLGVGGPIVARRQSELRQKADQAHEAADSALAVAVTHEAETRRNLYFSEMNLASLNSADAHGVNVVRELTDKWVPKKGETDLRGWEWHYLAGIFRHDIFSFEGHEAKVIAAEFSPDGSRVASLDRSGTICLWRSADGSTIDTFQAAAHSKSILRWSPDGSELAFFDPVGNLVRFDVESGEVAMKAPYSNTWRDWLAWSPDGSWLAIFQWKDRDLLIVDAKSGELRQAIKTGFTSVAGLAWSPDGSEIAVTPYRSGGMKIWRVEPGAPPSEPRSQKGDQLRYFSWSGDGKYLAGEIGGWPLMSVGVLDAVTLEEVHRFPGHFEWVTSVLWSGDSQEVISAAWDRTVRIWKLEEPSDPLVIACRERPLGISRNPRGPQIVITEGEKVRVVDGNLQGPGSLAMPLKGIDRLMDLRWGPDGDHVLLVGRVGYVRLWQPDAGLPGRKLQGLPKKEIWSCCWSPDGTRVATASADVRIWSVADGKELMRLDEDLVNVVSVDWSPDGECLAGLKDDGTMCIWPAKGGTALAVTLPGGGRPKWWNDVKWNPDTRANQLAVSCQGSVEILDAASLSTIRRLDSSDTSQIHEFEWSPDSSCIAVARKSGPVEIFDSQSGKLIRTVPGHDGYSWALTWSPDGTRLATAGGDRFVRVWEPQSGLLALTIQADAYPVEHLDWSPDGGRLVSGGLGNRLQVWGSKEQRSQAVTDTGPVLRTKGTPADQE